MQLLEVEDAKTLVRWIVPYVLLYVKCEPINRWPEQRQPERAMLVQTMSDAITQSGVDHFELTKFIEELTQGVLPAMPTIPTQSEVFKNNSSRGIQDSYQSMILGRRIKRGLRPRIQKPRAKCLRCGRSMLASSLGRHTKKFHRSAMPFDTQETNKFNSRAQNCCDEVSLNIRSQEITGAIQLPPLSTPNLSHTGDVLDCLASCDSSGMLASVEEILTTAEPEGRASEGTNSAAPFPLCSSAATCNALITNHPDATIDNLFSNLWQFPSQLHQQLALQKHLQQQSENFIEPTKNQSSTSSEQQHQSSTTSHSDENCDDDDSDSSMSLCEGTKESHKESSHVEFPKSILRHHVDLPKLQEGDHPDLARLQKELTVHNQLQGRTSLLQTKLLMTTLCRILQFSRSEIVIDHLRFLDHALDVAIKTPRIIIPYISSYTSQTPIASSIRNEVNRIRDLLRWRSNLLLIGSMDDLSRRQMDSMEAFLKQMQSSLQRMVCVKNAEELNALGMWSTMKQLRDAVLSALHELRRNKKAVCEISTEIALRFQQTVLACAYVAMRPQRRSVWRDMKLSQIARTYTTSVFKTHKQFQLLAFTFPDQVYDLLQEWIQVYRPIIAKRFTENIQDEGWVFVTLSGRRRDISSDISEFFSRERERF